MAEYKDGKQENSAHSSEDGAMPIDYSRYPPNWKTEIVPAIIARANNKCECCGLENKQIVYSISLPVRINYKYKQRTIWFRNEQDARREDIDYRPVAVVLTIAHLDHDEDNWNVKYDRLKAMCQICHLRYDATEKYRQKKLKDPHWQKITV